MPILIIHDYRNDDKSFKLCPNVADGLSWLKEYCDAYQLTYSHDLEDEYVATGEDLKVELLLLPKEVKRRRY
jgi:hypothetical protein